MDQYLLALSLCIRSAHILSQPVPQILQEVIPVEPPVALMPEFTETTTPRVDTLEPPKPFERSDGFTNMCYPLDGTYTTTIMKDWEAIPVLFEYKGSIDPLTEAPADFTEAVAWCEDNK